MPFKTVVNKIGSIHFYACILTRQGRFPLKPSDFHQFDDFRKPCIKKAFGANYFVEFDSRNVRKSCSKVLLMKVHLDCILIRLFLTQIQKVFRNHI